MWEKVWINRRGSGEKTFGLEWKRSLEGNGCVRVWGVKEEVLFEGKKCRRGKWHKDGRGEEEEVA